MSGQLDPSIITNAANIGATNSPMTAITNAAQTGNALYSLRQNQAGMAAGQDFQQAIDPNTGQLDSKKYNALLAADPRASLAAVQSSQAGQNNQATQLTNQQQQIQNGLSHLTYAANLATGYAESPPTKKQVISDLADGMNEGTIDATTAAKMASDPPFDAPQSVQQAYWKQKAQASSAAIGQVSRFLPTQVPIGAGGSTIVGQGNPLAPGYTAPGSVVTNSPSAEFQSTLQTVQLPDGSSFTGTPAQIQAKLGSALPAATITPPGGAAPSGYGPQGLTPIGAPSPQAAPTPAAPGPQGGGIVVPAGAATSAATLANDQTTQFSNDVASGANNAQAMSNIYEIGAAAKGANTGPGSAREAGINALGAEVFGGNAGQATDEQILAKASGMLTAANLTNFGASSDAKLGAAMGITPNGTMTEQGVSATLAMTAGTRLYGQYKAEAAQAWKQQGGNPADPNNGYNAFQLQFQRTTSPLILSIPFMPPTQLQQLQTYVHSLPRAQQVQFNAMYKASSQAGYLSAPGQ